MANVIDGAARAGLAPKEFARITGRGDATIYRWIKSGYVKAVRIGPRLLIIPMGEVERILGQDSGAQFSGQKESPGLPAGAAEGRWTRDN